MKTTNEAGASDCINLPEEFLSCQFIEGNILFGHDFLGFCCVTHTNPTKGNVKICSFSGGELPLERILERRQTVRRDNNDPERDTPCKGCYFLKRQNWRKKYLFDRILVAHSTFCNLECAYCYTMKSSPAERHATALKTYDLTAIFRKLIDDKLLSPDAFISWAGGEPTLFKDFEPMMSMALKTNMKMQMATNATVYSDSARQAIESGQLTIITSIDAGTRETYRKVRGKDQLSNAWATLSRYVAANPKSVTVQYIVLDENYTTEELSAFVAMCSTTGVQSIAIARDFNKYRGPMSNEKKEFPDDMVNAIVDLAFKAVRSNIKYSFLPHFMEHELATIRLRLLKLLVKDHFKEHAAQIRDLAAQL